MLNPKIIGTILFGLSLFVVATLVLKDLPESTSWLTLDTAFHVVGGVFAAWCGSLLSRHKLKVFLLAMAIGLTWELAEYFSLIYGPSYWPIIYNYYHGGGLIDTSQDLFADMFGAISFILLYYYYENFQEK